MSGAFAFMGVKTTMHGKSQSSEKPASSISLESCEGVIELDNTYKLPDFKYMAKEGRGGGRGSLETWRVFPQAVPGETRT
jgi:hypothetical protein